MSNRFIKFLSDSEEAIYLQQYHPNAFLLLCQVARRARRLANCPDGREVGEAFIGDYWTAGIETEKKYRVAKEVLIKRGHLLFVESRRNAKNGATKRATKGTCVKLLTSSVWDVNLEIEGDQKGEQRATKGRLKGDKQERQERKNEKKAASKESESESSLSSSLFYECLRTLALTDKQKLDICNFDEEIVQAAVKVVTARNFKIKKTLMASLMFFCQNPPEKSMNEIKAREYIEQIRNQGYEEQAIISEKLLEKNAMMLYIMGSWTTTSIKDLGVLIQDIKESRQELESLKKAHKVQLAAVK